MGEDEMKRAAARALARPAHPGVKLERDGDEWLITAPDGDLQSWELALSDTFGTRSVAAMQTFVRDLKSLCRDEFDDATESWRPSETELNAALAMVADIEPRNMREAALAAQMVAVHWMQMQLSRDALNNGGMILDKEASLASKLARTYAIQLETLRALRGGKRSTKQTIVVKKSLKQEVHYHRHGSEGAEGKDNQPDGRTIDGQARITDQREALRGQDKGGRVVPMPRSKGQG